MNNIVIHHNNTSSRLFDNSIKFKSSDDIDRYISDKVIPKLLEKDFDRIFIKDNLSTNYLELLGLRVAYHIRLSKKELGEKRFCPIIILSDLDSSTLNKFDPMARILFTKNVFISSNTKDEIEKFKTKEMKNLTEGEYREKFLNLIDIEAPEDYTDEHGITDDHGITNEWAIYQWSNALELTTDAIKINHNKITSMLYFKYLQSLHEMNDASDEKYEIKSLRKKGKILYIDDEWNKGWSDILGNLFPNTNNIEFTTFKRINQDANQEILIPVIKGEVKKYEPDVVILDLRLVTSDHKDKADLDSLTGIQLVQEIKKINPGIQVIMMTATRQSVILEKLYDYGILGYIKKEHPNDVSVHTVENMAKLFKLAENGLDQKYLKRVWSIQNKLIKLNMILNAEKERDNLNTHIKGKSINLYELQENKLSEESEKLLELKSTILMMYEILDSNIKKKFSYSVLTIFKCLEIVSDYYIKEESKTENKKRIFYAIWKHNNKIISQKGNCSVNNKLSNVINKIFIETHKDLNQDKNRIVCTRNAIIHPDTIMPSCEDKVIAEDNLNEEDILNWFEMLCDILENMDVFETRNE